MNANESREVLGTFTVNGVLHAVGVVRWTDAGRERFTPFDGPALMLPTLTGGRDYGTRNGAVKFIKRTMGEVVANRTE